MRREREQAQSDNDQYIVLKAPGKKLIQSIQNNKKQNSNLPKTNYHKTVGLQRTGRSQLVLKEKEKTSGKDKEKTAGKENQTNRTKNNQNHKKTAAVTHSSSKPSSSKTGPTEKSKLKRSTTPAPEEKNKHPSKNRQKSIERSTDPKAKEKNKQPSKNSLKPTGLKSKANNNQAAASRRSPHIGTMTSKHQNTKHRHQQVTEKQSAGKAGVLERRDPTNDERCEATEERHGESAGRRVRHSEQSTAAKKTVKYLKKPRDLQDKDSDKGDDPREDVMVSIENIEKVKANSYPKNFRDGSSSCNATMHFGRLLSCTGDPVPEEVYTEKHTNDKNSSPSDNKDNTRDALPTSSTKEQKHVSNKDQKHVSSKDEKHESNRDTGRPKESQGINCVTSFELFNDSIGPFQHPCLAVSKQISEAIKQMFCMESVPLTNQ